MIKERTKKQLKREIRNLNQVIQITKYQKEFFKDCWNDAKISLKHWKRTAEKNRKTMDKIEALANGSI